jgi:hypothetical protein
MQWAVIQLAVPTSASAGAVTQGGSGASGSSQDLAVLAIWIAAASLAISLLNFVLRTYRDDFRGPKVNLRMLMGPQKWDVRMFASAAGYLVEVSEAAPVPTGTVVINMSGDCVANLANHGSRDGMLWNLDFAVAQQPPGWAVDAHVALEPMKAVKGATPTNVTVIFRSETMSALGALQSLRGAHRDYEVKATYMADRSWLGRPGHGRASIKIPRAAAADGLRIWLRAHGANV